MANQELNPALTDMVANGQLDRHKIAGLMQLRAFVDGYARTRFVTAAQEQDLVQRFGTTPNVQTWGDYFQTEIASRFFDLDEAAFQRVLETVRYDIVAAILVFENKPPEFIDDILARGQAIMAVAESEWSPEDQEAAHLSILARYHVDMGLAGVVLQASDADWFENFIPEAQDQAASA